MIYLTPYAGLGNRIRVIASVYKYAKEHDSPLTINWVREPGFNCSFTYIFEKIKDVEINDHSIFNHFIYNNSSIRNLFVPTLIDRIKGRNSIYHLGINQLSSVAISEKDIYITTYSQQGEMSSIRNLFIPKRFILEKIEKLTSQFCNNTIGIHIRRTDNDESKKKSTISIFENAIISKIKTDSSISFFLSTDDKEIKDYLLKKYTDRILTYQSTLNRFTKSGIADAVVELWALANTSVIWGSYFSSYSEIASEICGAPLKIAGIDNLD